jgi:hypothetical protein
MQRRFFFSMSSLALLVALASPAMGAIVTQWSFNADGSSPKAPSTGAGSMSAIGGMTFLTSLSTDNSGSPGDMTPPNGTGFNHSQGMNGTATPATASVAAAASGSVGLRVNTNTTGFTNLTFSWHQAQGFRGSRYYQVYATTDGTTFAPVSGGTGSVAANLGNAWYDSLTVSNTGLIEIRAKDAKILGTNGDSMGYELSYSFPVGSAYENNPNFGVLLASVWAPGGNDYVSSFAGTTNLADTVKGYLRNGSAAGGGLRYDLITVSGVAVPEASTILCLSFASVATFVVHRVRSRRSVL